MADTKKVSAASIWVSTYAYAFAEMFRQAADDADIRDTAIDMPGVVHWCIQVANRAVAGLTAHADENGVEVVE